MIKVAMTVAGSGVFPRNLTGDILSFPEFKNTCVSYMCIHPDRLAVAAALGQKVARGLDAHPNYWGHGPTAGELSPDLIIVYRAVTGGSGGVDYLQETKK